MSQREDYLVRMDEARREAVRSADAEHKAMWAKLADQWEVLARQAGDLEGPRQDRRGMPGIRP